MFDSGCNPCAAVRSIVLSPHLLRSEDRDSVVCWRMNTYTILPSGYHGHPGHHGEWRFIPVIWIDGLSAGSWGFCMLPILRLIDSMQIANFGLFFSCISRSDANFDPTRPPGCCLSPLLSSPSSFRPISKGVRSGIPWYADGWIRTLFLGKKEKKSCWF